MGDYFLGEIRLFTYGPNHIPNGWVPCNGQLLQANTNMALYSLLGNTYGGVTGQNFNLPNLNGRMIVGTGLYTSPSGNVQYNAGVAGGTETVTLQSNNLPMHGHYINTANSYNAPVPTSNYFGNPNVKTLPSQPQNNTSTANLYAPFVNQQTPTVTLPANMVGSAGGSAPHENRSPYQVLYYCICVSGIYPPRQ